MDINSLNRRTSMALFSDPKDHYCHRVRIVLEEKGVVSEIVAANNDKLSEELLEVSPYAQLPVLADRDVALYDSVTLMEYLDERFPHPPLLPVYPGTRANMRLYIKRIEKDWCSIYDKLVGGNLNEKEKKKAKQKLRSLIVSTAPVFKEKPFFMSEDFSLVDCCIAPLLWRLPLVEIEIPKDRKNRPIHDYMKRVFTRPCFLESLSEFEKDIHSI